MSAQPADVLAVMDAMQWGFNLRRCPLCCGFEKDTGERDHHHNAECQFLVARAAVAELIDQVDRVATGLEADGRMPDAMTKAVAAKRLRAALARIGGGQ